MVSTQEKASTVKNTIEIITIYMLALLLLIGIAAGSLHIQDFAPESNVSNIEGDSREFYIKVNQFANISWFINGTKKAEFFDTDDSNYTKTNAVAGIWIVNAIAINRNGTVSMEWNWTVRRFGVNLTIDSTSRTTNAGTNASYALILQNNGTDTDSYNLTVENADRASTAALNISGNITLESGASQALILNVTNMSAGVSGFFRVNVTARSNNQTTKVSYINTSTNVIAVRGINLTNISTLNKITTAGTNATYLLSLNNTGSDPDTYYLSVTHGGASEASVNVTSISLNANEIRNFTLNVTNTSSGIFYVNVTATSVNDSTKSEYINTTTSVTALRGVNLTNISALNKTTTAGTNATYFLSLNNNGSDPDTYNLTVSPGGASEASVNVTPIFLNAGATRTFTLNVTDNAAGIFYVNVTATSVNDSTKYAYINTTTVSAIRGVNLTNISELSNTTAARTNFTYLLRLNNTGSEPDTYNLSVTHGGASVASVNVTAIYLNSNETGFFTLNVTNTSAGIFYVNVTATSCGDPTKYAHINTTTNVTAVRDLNLTNITVLSNTTTAGNNITYLFSLTNNGTDIDSYNLTVAQGGASVASVNVTSIFLNVNETGFFTLNVTNTSSGIFYVNVTATSVNDSTKSAYVNTTTNVTPARGVNLTNISVLSKTTPAGTNATYILSLNNNGSDPDSYNLTLSSSGASIASLNITSPISLNAFETRIFTLNVTNTSSGVFRVNVTVKSTNDSTKIGYINTTTIVPIVINITNPANGSINTTGYVNVTVILDAYGQARYLDWDGMNSPMLPNAPNASGTVFYGNMTGLLSGNYTFKVYANDIEGNTNVSETRTVTVDRTIVRDLPIDNVTGNVNETVVSSSPGGNITITIFNGTNATLYDKPISNITIDSLKTVNSTFMGYLDSSDRIVGENLSLGPEGARFSPDIQIRFNYTDAMIAGSSASDLRIKSFDTSKNLWVEQTPYFMDETGKSITANVSHFSTFALVRMTTTPTVTTPVSGNGGSSDGEGVIETEITSGENVSNIELTEGYNMIISKDILTVYKFTRRNNPIMSVNITGNTSPGVFMASVEVLKNTSTLVKIPPNGFVYKNINILMGTSDFATSKNIKQAVIKFRVDNTWMSANGVSERDIKLVKWDGTTWINLETKVLSKDDINTYFETNTMAFSSFAITALKGAILPDDIKVAKDMDKATTAKPEGNENQAPVQKNKIPGFEAIIAVVALLAAVFRKSRPIQ